MRAKLGVLQQTHGIRLSAKFRSVYSLAVFFGLRHFVISPIGINLRKLSTGAQLQTFPYPTASKSVMYSNAFMAKLGAQTLAFKMGDGQTKNRQKTQHFRPPRRVKSEPNQTWHDDRGPRARSCTSKTFGV